MDRLASKAYLPLLLIVCVLPGALTQTSAPKGCGSDVSSLYYNLCDLSATWGVVVESFATAGLVAALVLLIVMLASLPFVKDRKWRSALGLHVFFLIFTFGLFALTFAFIVGRNFATCASRRFLFGVLFAGCFSCLLMQAVRLNILARRNSAPRGWVWCLGALGLWLVEVIINTEWLIITIVRYPTNTTGDLTPATAVPCNIANQDFVMALIYVLNLLLAVVVASIPIFAGKHKRWFKDGALILVLGLLSVGIWVAWIVMYVYGNSKHGGPTWDDPTLAIALVSNAWVFLLLHTVPAACSLSGDDEDTANEEDLYPSRGYETILKEQSAQSIYVENKAFSMDEPNTGNKPVSPYSGYNGQLRSCVYQPTELAIITKGPGNQQVESYDKIPRASTGTPMQDQSGRTSPSAHVDDMRQIYSNVCLRALSIQCLFALGLVCLPFFHACWSVVHCIVAIQVSRVFAMCPFLLCGKPCEVITASDADPKNSDVFFSTRMRSFLAHTICQEHV